MTHADVHALVLKHLHELVPGSAGRDFDPRSPLNEIGVDSLDLVDVASRTMQEMGVKLPRTEIVHIHTLDDLINALLRAEQAAANAVSVGGAA